jgi:DNA-binding LacI/PurR family transcriptional regulator
MKNASPKKSRPRLRDIAAAAGVSVATASRVLNGSNRVAPEIQKAVLDAATILNIDLSDRNKTKTLVFILSNRAMLHAFHSRILIGAEAYCAAQGWDMIFLSFSYSPHTPWKELHLPKIVQRHDVVRAAILAGTNSTNLLQLLVDKGIPFAVLGNNVIGDRQILEDSDVVYSDDTQGGYEITRYLIQLGHRHIWFVGNTRLPWFGRCYEGYQRAMEEADLALQQSSIDSEDETEIGYLGTKSLLGRGNPVTAIFAGNDPTAHGVYKALRESGLRIPEDISVAGCNDTMGGFLYPALTTIREFPEQLGRHMVELILNRITKPQQPPQHISIPTEFIRRDSSSPPAPQQSAARDTAQKLALGR